MASTMVLEALGPLAAAVASTVAAVAVFQMWNHMTGADLLRETRRTVELEAGHPADIRVASRHGSHGSLRNVRLAFGGTGSDLAPEDLEIAVTTDTGPDGPAGTTILHWSALPDLERFGPKRAHHYQPGDHGADRHVFVWEPETDFGDRVHVWLRCRVDTGEEVRVRVAHVEHLTRLQMRRLGRAER